MPKRAAESVCRRSKPDSGRVGCCMGRLSQRQVLHTRGFELETSLKPQTACYRYYNHAYGSGQTQRKRVETGSSANRATRLRIWIPVWEARCFDVVCSRPGLRCYFVAGFAAALEAGTSSKRRQHRGKLDFAGSRLQQGDARGAS